MDYGSSPENADPLLQRVLTRSPASRPRALPTRRWPRSRSWNPLPGEGAGAERVLAGKLPHPRPPGLGPGAHPGAQGADRELTGKAMQDAGGILPVRHYAAVTLLPENLKPRGTGRQVGRPAPGDGLRTAAGGILVQRMLRAAKLDAAFYEMVEADPRYTLEALGVVVVVSAVSVWDRHDHLSGESWAASCRDLWALFFWVAWAGITLWVGTHITGDRRDPVRHGGDAPGPGLRPHPEVLILFVFIPVLGPLLASIASIWQPDRRHRGHPPGPGLQHRPRPEPPSSGGSR